MQVVNCIQGSEEWLAARVGKVGASRIADIVARTKTGYAASRANYAAELIAERLTGKKTENYTNAAMQWGTDNEPKARAMYEFMHNASVTEVGIVLHPTILNAQASPDGLVGDDGLIEIKCPLTATHIATLRGGEIDGRYVKQMQWQMACTGRAWCDFCSFDPRLPAEMQIHVRRVNRDPVGIADLEKEVRAFLSEIDSTVADLISKYMPTAEAAE
jgi:putative phage-type endonuclease